MSLRLGPEIARAGNAEQAPLGWSSTKIIMEDSFIVAEHSKKIMQNMTSCCNSSSMYKLFSNQKSRGKTLSPLMLPGINSIRSIKLPLVHTVTRYSLNSNRPSKGRWNLSSYTVIMFNSTWLEYSFLFSILQWTAGGQQWLITL